MFGSASRFCKKIFDGSFDVAEDSTKPCFKFEFAVPNPNKATAEYYAKKNSN
jgi:hypothetical protein